MVKAKRAEKSRGCWPDVTEEEEMLEMALKNSVETNGGGSSKSNAGS